jgi:hypothetical protein
VTKNLNKKYAVLSKNVNFAAAKATLAQLVEQRIRNA